MVRLALADRGAEIAGGLSGKPRAEEVCFDEAINSADDVWNVGAEKSIRGVGGGVEEWAVIEVDVAVAGESVCVGHYEEIVAVDEVELAGERVG